MNAADDRLLVAEALRAMRSAYAPYSHFQVGAAVLASSGKIYTGANVENASYGASICAERVAIFSAIAAGERKLEAIAICGGLNGIVSDYCPPCGICRQVMREFVDPKNFSVIVAKSANDYRTHSLDGLLPESFGPDILGV